MNKYILCIAVLIAFVIVVPSPAQKYDAATLSAFRTAMRSRVSAELTVIVRGDIGAITAWPGIEVVATAGDAAVVRGSVETLQNLVRNEAVAAMSMSRRCNAANDVSMRTTNIDDVHAGTSLPRAYKGNGVICGIFDVGVDPGHINFTDGDGAPRAQRIFHYTADDGTFDEYATPSQIATFTTDDIEETHGTHTLGTMAGSYSGRGADHSGSSSITYSGAAPAADIAIACGELYDANICAGVAQIMSYADSRGLPCVVNLSLGDILGPRDGTDPETAFLNNLTGPGRIVVLAAGNDGNNQLTFTRTFTPDLCDYRTFLRPWSVSKPIEGAVDLWANRGADPLVEIVLANYWTGEIFSSNTFNEDEEAFALSCGNAVEEGDRSDAAFRRFFVDSRLSITRSDNEGTNSRPNFWVEFTLVPNPAENPEHDISVALFIHDAPGNRIDGALRGENMRLHAGWLNGRDGYETPTGRMSISSLACGTDIISVGSWTARNSLTLFDGTPYTTGLGNEVGQVSSFTSYGTLVDGRSLPLVCAPGEAVVSSLSRYCESAASRIVATGDGMPWGYDSGTSMATPAVAGAIALWLEACPDLTPSEIADIIAATSMPFEGKADPRHGAGRFDAAAGLQEVLRRHAGGITGISVGSGAPVIVRRGNTLSIVASGGKLGRVEVRDITGRMIAAANSASNSLEMEIPDLRPGIYLVVCNAGSAKLVL